MPDIHVNNTQSATVTSERGTQFIRSCVEVWLTVGVTRRVFRYPFHLRVTAATRKRSWSFQSAQSAGGGLQLNTPTYAA